MSLATVASRALAGIDAPEVAVEVHLGPGLPSFTIVGLPDTEVREAKDRVRAALNHTQFEFPARRITVNLAPADLPKDSGRFDLPIAIGILAASGQISQEALAAHEFAGELSLTGELRPVRGALAMALQARASARAFILPTKRPQAASRARTYCGAHAGSGRSPLLRGEAAALRSTGRCPSKRIRISPKSGDIASQAGARVAARRHACIIVPPGTGKLMLAARFRGAASDEQAGAEWLRSIRCRPPLRATLGGAAYRRLITGSGAAMVAAARCRGRGKFARPSRRLFLDDLPSWTARADPCANRWIRKSFIRAPAPVAVPVALPANRGAEPLPLLPLRLGRLRCRAARADAATAARLGPGRSVRHQALVPPARRE